MDINELSRIQDMVNLDATDTGIPGYVRISSKFANHNVPRLRYKVADEEISVSITESPKVVAPKELRGVIPSKFKGIVEWISFNKVLLIEYWNNPNMLTRELLNKMRKID